MNEKELKEIKKATTASYNKLAKSEAFKLFRFQILLLIIIDRLWDFIELLMTLFNH